MSTNKSTEDKLLASVRKTKSAASTSSKPAKKKTVKKASVAAKKSTVSSKPSRAQKKQLIDLFQHGRRVWPD